MNTQLIRSTGSSTDDARDEATDEDSLSPDDIFHALQTNRRRETIRYLLDEDGPIRMRDVAEHVAARENDTTVSNLTSPQRQRVYIPLYQSHLPKLDELGVVEYDKPRGIVHPTPKLAVFHSYLEASNTAQSDADAPRSIGPRIESEDTCYATALAVSTALLLVSVVGVIEIPGVAIGALTATLFAFATLLTQTSYVAS